MNAEVRRPVQQGPSARTAGERRRPGDRMRVGLVAPPFVPVPPTKYGGTEGFLDTLARGLVADGHEVRLFTVGDATCPVERRWVFGSGAEPMGLALHELIQVRSAYEELADCDVIHDNTTVGPVWAAAVRYRGPVVMTCHGDLTPENIPVYEQLARWSALNAISHSQRTSAPSVPFTTVIHHGLDPERFDAGPGDGGYVMFLGRLAPEKGAVAAVEIARRAGVPIRIAAKMRETAEVEYFERFLEPLLGPGVEFLGEVGPQERVRQLGGAIALLNPITWAEPFGLVMVEALACGTPVVAYRQGSAPEIVEHGTTGFLCDDADQAVEALGRVASLDRRACRRRVETRFSGRRMVRRYEDLYGYVIAHHAGRVGGHEDAVGPGPRRRLQPSGGHTP